MKPLKIKPEYIACNSWVRINYKSISASTHGFYIMKRDVYVDNMKKFEKLFKGMLIEIIYNYPVSMSDIIESALREMKQRRLTFITRLKSEWKRTFPDGENILRFKEHIRLLTLRIERLERKMDYAY